MWACYWVGSQSSIVADVSYEWNYDKQFKDINNIYQVMANFHDTNKKIFLTDEQSSNNFAATLKAEMPDVEYITRTVKASKRLLANGNNTFKVDGRYADPDWLNIFDYKYIIGNREKALSDWVTHPQWHNYSFYSLLTLKKGLM